MRLSTVSFSLIILASCGGEKETTETDASTGATTTATATSGGTTGDGATDAPTSDPTEASTATTGATTHSSHSSVTGESSTSEGSSTGEVGETGSTTVATTDDASSSGGVEPVGTSIVENDCAPNDGAALQFKLEVEAPVCGTALAGEKLRILLWQGGPLPAGVYPIGEQTGFATFQVDNNEPTNSVAGTLTIESWVGDLVVGSYDLTFVDDSVRQGDFVGPFCMIDTFCG